MSKRRHAVISASVLTAVLGIVATGMEIMDRHMEAKARRAQSEFEMRVRLCEEYGRVWFRGDCVAQEEVRAVVHQP